MGQVIFFMVFIRHLAESGPTNIFAPDSWFFVAGNEPGNSLLSSKCSSPCGVALRAHDGPLQGLFLPEGS